MNTEDDKFWNDHAGKLRDWSMLRPLTPEEAEEAAESAPSVPLSDEEIQRIVAAAVPSGSQHPWEVDSEVDGFGWLDEADADSVAGGVLQLNRNKGERDEETDSAEEDLRRRMLDDEEADEGRLEDRAGPPRPGDPSG